MPRPHRKAPRLLVRRVIRRGDLEVPEIPITADGAGPPAGSEPTANQARPEAQPDSVDERIRRMIEAAYT